ncbi:MAG: T9SS-dependent M36 family metallopeptidase [Moheibacter sp.]
MNKIYFSVLCTLLSINIWAQESQILTLTKNYLAAESSNLNLKTSDLNDLTVQTNYTDQKTNIEYAYVQQNLAGYPIYNAIANFAIRDGKVVYMTQTFESNIHQRIGNQNANNDLNSISAVIAQNMGYTLNQTAFYDENFGSKLMYFPTEDGKLNLSWITHLRIMEDGQLKIMEVIANAQTGEIYSKFNQLLSCEFEDDSYDNPMTKFKQSEQVQWLNAQFAANTMADGASYRVYDPPIEAPTFGERTLVSNPADPTASPFGWHDTNGAAGPEYTNTQGNNVTAVNDQHSEGLNWLYNGGSYTFHGFAEGGSSLTFDFPIDFTRNLYESADASTTNLFFINNIMHDLWYQYGFTEPAGNFQVNNYGNGGLQTDQVWAFGQTGEAMGSMNNAMFGTPADGGNPYMIMFMWTSNEGDSHLFSVTTPGAHQGNYDGVQASFGGALPNPPLVKNLAVIKNDNTGGSADPNDGCGAVTNASELNGKIVMIKRGQCDFVVKVKKAQNAGALAVVMVNNVAGAPIAMGGSDPTITIPSVMIRDTDGNPIMAAILSGTNLEGSIPKDGHWDGYKDGTFDSGVMAHEYTHGISNRLTGGPNTSGCLNNEEQMGEGWSDYAGLVMTMNTGDQGADGRGIGTYVVSQPTNGVGIRPTRYSTDMSINPSTYNTIKTAAVPHGVGYVWATMRWEMTWEMVDLYGFSPDFYFGNGGNNVAMQLVIDGMKLQPCKPGFVDGRNAILQADINNNGGVNQCHIWKAFAKRGLGYSASQGSSNSRSDGTEAFDMPPTNVLDCTNMATSELINSELSLYPNPTKGEFYILTDKAYQDSFVSIQDLTGKTVYQSDIDLKNKRATVDVSSLSTGIYVIVINTPEGKITKKLIKN